MEGHFKGISVLQVDQMEIEVRVIYYFCCFYYSRFFYILQNSYTGFGQNIIFIILLYHTQNVDLFNARTLLNEIKLNALKHLYEFFTPFYYFGKTLVF